MGVWIETVTISLNSVNILSHPSWVCGLKQALENDKLFAYESHPSWVCGLKLLSPYFGMMIYESHPSWVCGLKQMRLLAFVKIYSHTLRGCVD